MNKVIDCRDGRELRVVVVEYNQDDEEQVLIFPVLEETQEGRTKLLNAVAQATPSGGKFILPSGHESTPSGTYLRDVHAELEFVEADPL